MANNFELKLYAVRSKDGLWYKSRGQGGYGPRWVDGIDKAKVYTKPGPAKAIITYWGKNYPNFPVPDLVEIIATDYKIIAQEQRLKDAKEKKAIAAAAYEIKRREAELKSTKKRMEEAQAELDRLKKKQEDIKPLQSSVLQDKIDEATIATIQINKDLRKLKDK